MNIFKVEGVGSIFRDILHHTFYVVDCVTSISIVFAEISTIYHVKVRFNFWIRMNPHIDECIQLSSMIFSEGGD